MTQPTVKNRSNEKYVFDKGVVIQHDVYMAKTTVITDDLDGSANADTVDFALGSDTYTIDLSKKNKAALQKVLKPYIDAAKKTSGRGVRRPASGPRRRSGRSSDLAAIRSWAAENGHQVSDRGRIAAPIVAAYEAAH